MASPLFAVLFAVYPVLFIAIANPGQVERETLLPVIAIAIIGALVGLVSIRLLFTSWLRAALGVAVLIFLFFAYGPTHTLLENAFLYSFIEIGGIAHRLTPIAPHLHPILSTLWILAAAVGLYAVSRLPEAWTARVAHGCNTMALVLVVLVGVQWSAQRGEGGAATGKAQHPAPQAGVSALGYNPDVYAIILDGYPREDVLRHHYQFDNSEFLNGLRKRGFDVGEASSANYNWTFLSLASFLNMDYLQLLLRGSILPGMNDRAPVYDAIRNNAVVRFFGQRGYRIVHFQTTWGPTIENPYADEQVPCHQSVFTNEFYRVLAEASWLKARQSRLTSALADCHLSNLANLGRMGGQPGPKFVFAHFLPPHHPYLFDRDGNVLRDANLSNQFEFQKMLWEQKASYLDQLVFMNGRILDVVDKILAASQRPPIIMIQSDHGPNLADGLSGDEKARIRLANFAAELLPEAPPHLIPRDGSSVNRFRYILNHYFNAGMDILPNRYYFSADERPYDFVERTAPAVRLAGKSAFHQ